MFYSDRIIFLSITFAVFPSTSYTPLSPNYLMRDRNNPLKTIPPNAFTIIQASHTYFHKSLADIPIRYPKGKISYFNNHQFVPLLQLKDGYQDRLIHREMPTLEELLTVIESDTSAILFIEYYSSWFPVDSQDDILRFNGVCRDRAKKGGPVVLITAIMDRALLKLDGKADYFFQIGDIEIRGKRLEIKEQKHLNEILVVMPGPGEKRRMYGQVKLGEW